MTTGHAFGCAEILENNSKDILMTQKTIIINEEFNAPVNEVFNTLSDHEKFGEICGIKMTRIHDGEDGAKL